MGAVMTKVNTESSRRHRGLARAASCAVVALCLMSTGGCAPAKVATERKHFVARTVLSDVRPEMKTAGFWIGRMSEPDKIILDEDGIRRLNEDIQTRLQLTKNIIEFPGEFDGNDVRMMLQQELESFRNTTLYDAEGREVDDSFYVSINDNMQVAAIAPTVAVRFGCVVHNADQRRLPTGQRLYAELGEIDFDEVQNNALDIGTPVAILHESADQQWLYVAGPSSDGWVEAEDVALCARDRLRGMAGRAFVTIVRAKGSIYLDKERTQYHGFVRMGTKLALSDDSAAEVVGVVLPTRRADGVLETRTGYLKRRETHRGYLLYTPRHIIEQAFEMLNAPYGWGGAEGQQDCSQFVQEVFATVGIALPRNSSAQARVGRVVGRFWGGESNRVRRNAIVTQAVPGTSILYMRGHVMLYIGHVSQRPYAIHNLWAYREPTRTGDEIRVINRVAVTDLSLGAGARKGSLLRRLRSIQAIAANSG